MGRFGRVKSFKKKGGRGEETERTQREIERDRERRGR